LEKQKINILISDNDPEGALFWTRVIADIHDMDIESTRIEKLSDVLKYLETETPEVILLDLSRPEGGGFEVFLLVYNAAPDIPIIVITGTSTQKLAFQTALDGAQDSLLKGEINGYSLSRSMRQAMGRQTHLRQLNTFSVIDELTGLNNRRGFLILADQQIKMSKRMGQSLFLVFADVDDLKTINDTLGHHWGDIALMETSHVLREAFRETDILGRLSGDEFVALLNCAGGIDKESLISRFQETMDAHNAYPGRNFQLSISIGIALFDPHTSASAHELLENADSLMYEQKNLKKALALKKG
jgi:diguanylate cyclase (GGDEF)-like protein